MQRLFQDSAKFDCDRSYVKATGAAATMGEHNPKMREKKGMKHIL